MITRKQIKDKILNDDKTATVIEYMFSKALTECAPNTLKFIYKNHKIIRGKNKKYSIYRLSDGLKLFGNIRYQDMAKYIIDNLNNSNLVNNIIELEKTVQRFKDKIEFLKMQYSSNRYDNYIIESKLENAFTYYRVYKKEFLSILRKSNVC